MASIPSAHLARAGCNRVRSLVCGLLGASYGYACVPPAAEAVPPSPVAGFREVPLGLCEDYPEESRSLGGVRRDLALLKSAGARVLRVSIGWDGVEPERNRYDFAFWDAFVDLAVREYGVTLIPYIAYTPRWASAGNDSEFWKTPPLELAEFAEIVELLAERYRGQVHSWEIWNEPDNRDYWIGTVDDYAALLKAGAEAVHKASPEAKVVSGGLAGNVEFLAELFDRLGEAAALVDVVNLHSYYETWNPGPLEALPGYVAEAAQVVARHGGGQAIWMAEVGYSNFRQGGQVSAFAKARFAYEHTLPYQAVALARTAALMMSSPALSLAAWYELKDPPSTDEMIGDVNNRHLGVAFTDYRPKPALHALAFMNQVFAGGVRVVDAQLQVSRAAGSDPARSDLQLHGFESPRHTLTLFAWLRTQGKILEPSAPRGDAEDTRREVVQVTVPYRARGPATLYNELGQERAAGRLQQFTAHSTLQLDLRGGEIQIIELPIEPD